MKTIIITLISSIFFLNISFSHDQLNNNEEENYDHDHNKNKDF